MSLASSLLAVCLSASSLALAQSSNGLLTGFTFRMHGGLEHMAGLSDLNQQIHGMNEYFGTNGTWVTDAQGENVNFGNWAPYLKIGELNNRSDVGLTIERDMLVWSHSRLVAGVEFTGGATSKSNLFEFSPGTGFRASIFAEESVDVSNFMATCRYSLKDLNLPVHAHVGLGVGMGNIDAVGTYIQKSSSTFITDPMYNQLAPYHVIDAAYDGSAVTGRVFLGSELLLGNLSIMLDLGYNHMNFDELEGSTTQVFRNELGEMVPSELSGEPATRYEFAPLISASLQHQRDNAFLRALGLPPNNAPIDLNNPELEWGSPSVIKYDLSGGYVRLSLGYRL